MYSKQLTKSQVDEVLEELGHTEDVRAETLDVLTLVKLGNRFGVAVKSAE
jgi:16S rRNA A1518/A1519 N6-dimethyltransferase RsmA/KsgA/DIM1 with predicted DNA glycosylase/AP lyase activity